ncbi:MAG: DNA alkylation repair protein [Nanoarchaeota archaeon]
MKNSFQTLREIDKELKENIDEKYKEGAIKYFKEKINPIGVRTKIVDKISAKYFKETKCLDKKEIFEMCEELLKSGEEEKKHIAFDWAFRLKKEYDKNDFEIFERWLKKYVSNWACCDDFCSHAFGYLIFKFPKYLKEIKKLAHSKNRWEKRASAVIMLYSIRENQNIEFCFKIADILLEDSDDLVQKGYGWMLKVVAEFYQRDVFDYVMRNKQKMPRTALRYAIEKFPKDLREECLKRD